MAYRQSDCVVGMALWLLEAPTLVERIEWIVRNEMGGVALHQNIMQVDSSQRAEAAAAIREAGLVVTYHGNVTQRVDERGQPDEAFVARMIQDVLWWHEHTGGVRLLRWWHGQGYMQSLLVAKDGQDVELLDEIGKTTWKIPDEYMGKIQT